MNIDIRKHVIENFKGLPKKEIEESICESIEEKDDIVLPGLGVFFELLWKGSNKDIKEEILTVLEDEIEKESK